MSNGVSRLLLHFGAGLVGLDGNSWVVETELYFIDIHGYDKRPLGAAVNILVESCWIPRLLVLVPRLMSSYYVRNITDCYCSRVPVAGFHLPS